MDWQYIRKPNTERLARHWGTKHRKIGKILGNQTQKDWQDIRESNTDEWQDIREPNTEGLARH